MALTVELNGRQRTFEDFVPGSPLQDLLTALELKSDRVAVERNGEIVGRAERGSVAVENGDRIEIVHFVGGGR